MASNMELQLLLKLNDQMSRGLKAAMTSAQKESKGLASEVTGVARAADKIKTTGIVRLTDALNKAKGAARSTLDVIQRVANAGAAAAAGGYVLKSAIQKPMSLDMKLAQYSNTAYGGSVENRIAGRRQLEAGVNNAVRLGGGSRDDAADTLNSMISSGAMGEGKKGVDSSINLLPTIQQLSTATGASGQDLASIVQSLKQQMKMSDDEVKTALAKAVVGGQQGGFDLNNMAKWLPQQIALAVSNGMTGMNGFETLVAANQASRITAGTPDEAGNNLVNLLAKITSNDTANDFKKQHIDLYGSLISNVGKGMSPLDAFVGMIKKTTENDKQYQDLKKKSESASDPDKKALYDSMASILMAKGIGKSVQDRQALTALLALILQNGKYQQVKKSLQAENGGEIDKGFKAVADTTGYKAEQLGNEKDIAASTAFSAVSGPLGTMLQGIVSVSQAHPVLAAAAYTAATALGSIAAIAGLKGILSAGGGSAAVGALAVAGGGIFSQPVLTAALAGGMNLSALAGMGVSGMATIAGGVGIAGVAGYGAGTLLNKGINSGLSAITGSDTSLGSLIYDLLHKEKEPVKIVVDVKNGNIVASVNDTNSRQATRR